MRMKAVVLGLALGLGVASGASAYTATVLDRYYGAQDHGYGDIVGTVADFQITKAEFTVTNTGVLTAIIYTNFADKPPIFTTLTKDPITGAADGKGVGYGDLLFSDKWTPVGTAPTYLADNMNQPGSTRWTYGLSLDNRWRDGKGFTDGVATLYSLVGNNSDLFDSNDFMRTGTGATWRDGQAVAVDTRGKTAVRTGAWTVGDGTITFNMDLAGTGLADGFAFHWTMTCANDVIEGVVPEPITTVLIMSGLVGLVGVGRYGLRKS